MQIYFCNMKANVRYVCFIFVLYTSSTIAELKESISTSTANGVNNSVSYNGTALNSIIGTLQDDYAKTNHTSQNHGFFSHFTAQKIGVTVAVVVVAFVVALTVAFICYRKRCCCGTRYTLNYKLDKSKREVIPNENSNIQTYYEDLNKADTRHHSYSSLNRQSQSKETFSNNGFEISGEYLEPVKSNDLYESIKIEEQNSQMFFQTPQMEANKHKSANAKSKRDSECYVDINDERLYSSVN